MREDSDLENELCPFVTGGLLNGGAHSIHDVLFLKTGCLFRWGIGSRPELVYVNIIKYIAWPKLKALICKASDDGGWITQPAFNVGA